MTKLNLTGQKFSRLNVLSKAEAIGGRTAWNCQCDCGNTKIVKTDELRSGDTKSCGCLNKEQRSARAKNMYSANIKYDPRTASARRVWKASYSEMLFEDFYKLSQQNCYYCKSAPNNVQNVAKSDAKSSTFAKENGDFIYNGIDRLNNKLDHSDINNCVACCKYCNWAKRERSVEDFKTWIKVLFSNFILEDDKSKEEFENKEEKENNENV